MLLLGLMSVHICTCRQVRLEDALAVLILGDEPTSSMRVEEDSIFLSAISVSNYLEHALATSTTSSSSAPSSSASSAGPAGGLLSRRRAQSGGVAERRPRPRLVTALTHTAKLRCAACCAC